MMKRRSNQMRSFARGAYFVMLLLLCACLLSCNSGEELLWTTDQYGRFITQDLARAQEEIPFPIVVPSYLPDNLGKYPLITGPLKGQWKEDELEVDVVYQAVGLISDGLIEINEYNHSVTLGDPALNPGYVYSEIAGTEVVETEHTRSMLGDEGVIHISGWIFGWNKDDVYFVVQINGYDRDTTVKIVESMIEQL